MNTCKWCGRPIEKGDICAKCAKGFNRGAENCEKEAEIELNKKQTHTEVDPWTQESYDVNDEINEDQPAFMQVAY